MQTTVLPATAVKDEDGQYDTLKIGEMGFSISPKKVKCRAFDKKQRFKNNRFVGNAWLEGLYRASLVECRKLIVFDRSLENLVCIDRVKDGKIARPNFFEYGSQSGNWLFSGTYTHQMPKGSTEFWFETYDTQLTDEQKMLLITTGTCKYEKSIYSCDVVQSKEYHLITENSVESFLMQINYFHDANLLGYYEKDGFLHFNFETPLLDVELRFFESFAEDFNKEFFVSDPLAFLMESHFFVSYLSSLSKASDQCGKNSKPEVSFKVLLK